MKCSKCLKDKSPDDFYRNRRSCKDCDLAANREWRRKNHERLVEYEASMKEHRSEYGKRYYAQKRKEILERHRRWRAANPDYDKVNYADNPARHIAKANKRRALKLNALGEFSATEWLYLKRQTGNKCLACGVTEEELIQRDEILHADHVIPLSREGDNGIWNIQPLCRACNSRKATQTIDYRSKE